MAEKFILDNGLTVLIEETPQLPVAAIQCGFKVGSIYEKEGEAGICHLIEHMLFKGTKKRPKAGQVAYDAECLGADINAFTSFENTVYHLTMSSRYFAQGLEIIADMVISPLFDAAELAREKEVVCEEILRGRDHPSRVLSEELFKAVYRKHPYRLPIIGTPESVRAFSAEKLRSFYQKWYGSKNAVVVIVSDVPVKKVLQEVTQQFAAWQGGSPVHPPLPRDALQTRPKFIWKKKTIQGTYFDIAWSIPEFTHPDVPALDLLSHVLGEGGASRLETQVKEKQHLVQAIHSYAYTPKDAGVFVVGGVALEKDLKKAFQAVVAEIHRLQDEGVTEAELDRAYLNLQSERYYEKQTVDGIARKLMFFECTTGDYEIEKAYYERLSQLGAPDIQKAAQHYLRDATLTAAVLSKTPKSFEIADVLAPLEADRTKRPAASRPSYKLVREVKDIALYRLKNGIRVLVRPNVHLPLVALYAGVPGGLRAETAKTGGEGQLISRLLTKGTTRRSNEQVAIDAEKIAGDVDGFSGRHALGIHAQMLSSKKALGFDLFFDTLRNSRFGTAELDRERFLTLEAIRQQEDAPASLVWKHFLKLLFPTHPYGMPSLGDPEVIKQFTAKGLKEAYRRALTSDQLVIAAVGDFAPDWVLEQVDAYCRDLSPSAQTLPLPKLDPPPRKIITEEVVLKKEQAHIALGFQGPSLTSPDRYALSVLNTVLAGQGGRLFLTLRDQESLAYTVTSYLMEGIQPGFFAVYIACDPKKIDAAVAGMKRELEKVCSKPISKEELARAKHQIVSGYQMDLQRNSNVAHQLFANEICALPAEDFYDLPKHFETVTAADVLTAARHYINLDAYALCVLRP